MLVKDLIEELKRCEPSADVKIRIIYLSALKDIGKPKVDRVIIHTATIEVIE
jgi:hypothetical protein